MPNELEPQITQVSPQDMIKYSWHGWIAYFNSVPSKESIWLLLSYWAITTDWGSDIHNYNVGKLLSVESDGYDYIYFTRCEQMSFIDADKLVKEQPKTVNISYTDMHNKSIVWFLPKHPRSRMRAYLEAKEGIVDYLSTLARRFAPAWSFVVAPDARAFTAALRELGYVSEPVENKTQSGFADVMVKYMKAWEGIEFDYESVPILTNSEKEQIKNLISLNLIGENNG